MTLLPDGDGVFRERRTVWVDASAATLWSCVAELGGAPGWYAADRLWALRHRLDGWLGGPGRRGRPDRPLRIGDPVDGWRVCGLEPGRSLTLRSEHRMPGHALLTHQVLEPPEGRGVLLVQRLEWHPRGRSGRLMWWLELPAHVAVMSAMVRNLGREASRRQFGLVGVTR